MKTINLLVLTSIITFLIHIQPWSSQEQQSNICVTKTNVKGKVNGTIGDNISINGLIEHIPLYYIPATNDLNPTSNIAYINLYSEKGPKIKTIIKKKYRDQEHNKPLQKTTYSGKDYVFITVTFALEHEKTEEKDFLIEANSYICYTESSTQVPSKLLFDAMDIIEIII